MEQSLGVLCGPQALWVLCHVLSVKSGVDLLELFPSHNIAVRHGIFQ